MKNSKKDLRTERTSFSVPRACAEKGFSAQRNSGTITVTDTINGKSRLKGKERLS